MNTLPLLLVFMLVAASKYVSGLLSTAGPENFKRIRTASTTWRLFSDLDDLMDMVLSDPDLFKKQRSANSTNGQSSSLWKSFDWESIPLQELKPSPVETMLVNDRIVYIKCDHQLRLPGSQISGNKARKMLALNQVPSKDFPRAVVSYGGPQSNAMLALAAIVHFQNQTRTNQQLTPCRFVYYTKKLPKFLRENSSGNLFRAQSLGMEMIELSNKEYNNLFGSDWGGSSEPPLAIQPPVPGGSLWIPQGGANGAALPGARQLAQEVVDYWTVNGKGRPLTLCCPGGTCSTALLLHNAIQAIQKIHQESTKSDECHASPDIEVVVIPCVGDEFYAKRQMLALNAELGFRYGIPAILSPVPDDDGFRKQFPDHTSNSYFQFGEPNREIYDTYTAMKEEGMNLDLLYGAPSWTILRRHLACNSQTIDSQENFNPRSPFVGRCVMYIHSGGLEGINTQLMRYKYKGIVSKDEIQNPGKW